MSCTFHGKLVIVGCNECTVGAVSETAQLRASLNEATALLGRIHDAVQVARMAGCDSLSIERLDSFFSAAPAQPAAPEPSGDRELADAWAERDRRVIAQLRTSLKSAEAQLAAERESHQATCDIAEIYRTDLNASEVRLAAVGRWLRVNGPYAFCSRSAYRACRALLAVPASQSQTPSPGAGEETLCGVTAWSGLRGVTCEREAGHTGAHSHPAADPGRSGK